MAVVKPVFLRPIEITADNNTFTVSRGPTTISLPTGLYANIVTVMASMNNSVRNDGAGPVSFTIRYADGYDFLTYANTAGADVTWDDTDLRDLLGFTTNLTGGSTFNSDYSPAYAWVPTFNKANQSVFEVDQRREFIGKMASDGTIAGTTAGPTIHYLDLEFQHELATNIFESKCTNAYEVERCLETFGREARTAYPSVDTILSPKGFYYYPDANVLHTDPPYTTSNDYEITDSGDIHFDYSSSADEYVFCHLDTIGYRKVSGSPSLPQGMLRYNVNLEIHTAPAPNDGDSWQFVEYTP